MAARKYFEEELELVECDSFKKVAKALHQGQSEYGIMAIENTLAGSLLPNYALIQKYGFYVVGEVYLHIKMNLMANEGVALSDIKEVLSHPVALAQCDDFLESRDDVELVEYHDTAAAAKWVKETGSKEVAAISNDLSAELYGLNILSESIETHKENFTRFLLLSKDPREVPNANKASLSLEVSHTPGSLADVLLAFKNKQVNLTKIQSVPIIGKPYQYAFKIDLTWESYSNYKSSVKEVESLGTQVKVLGEYRAGSY